MTHDNGPVPARADVEPPILSALDALATALRIAGDAPAAAITMSGGQDRWITATSGTLRIADGTDLFSVLRDAAGASPDQPVMLSAAAIRDRHAGRMLSVDNRPPDWLACLCISCPAGNMKGALCILGAAPSLPDARSGTILSGFAEVAARLLAMHDQIEDRKQVVTLGRATGWAATPDGILVEMAQSLRTLLGIEPGEDLDLQVKQRLHPDDVDSVMLSWRRAHGNGTALDADCRLRTPDRGYRWFRLCATPERNASGAVTRWCGSLEDVHEHRTDRRRLAHLADHDALTGLGNHAYFRQVLQRHVAAVGRGRKFSLARLELHDLQAVNGAPGPAIGDRLLPEAAKRIGASIRETDLLAHDGGQIFSLLLDGIEQADDVAPLVGRILAALQAPMPLDGSTVPVGVAIGVTFCPADGADADKLLQNADLALLRARSAGGGCRLFSRATDEQARRGQVLTLELGRALDRKQFFLVYQPVLDTRIGRVRGFEALLRWAHPAQGIVPPADFIPEAENSGLIVPIGAWVIEQACRDAAGWPSPLGVGVNLSVVQIRSPGLVGVVARVLQTTGLDPSRLVLEITESLPLLGEGDNLPVLHALRALGVRIALDDFGTGYASLSCPQCFSFDVIKIERSFVARMLDNAPTRTIMQAVIGLGRSLGSVSVAEGVETRAQLDMLLAQGCDAVQGFLIGHPVETALVPQAASDLVSRLQAEGWLVPGGAPAPT